jgi:hypothetical protein
LFPRDFVICDCLNTATALELFGFPLNTKGPRTVETLPRGQKYHTIIANITNAMTSEPIKNIRGLLYFPIISDTEGELLEGFTHASAVLLINELIL